MEVTLAKPPSDKKKKEEILRARERRMMQMMQCRSGYLGCNALIMPPTVMMPPMEFAAGMGVSASSQPRLPLRGPLVSARDYRLYC